MNLITNFALLLSVAIIVGSVILSIIGYERNAFSRRDVAIFSEVGVGIGCGIFIFFGFSNGDFWASLIVAIITGLVIGISRYIFLGRRGK